MTLPAATPHRGTVTLALRVAPDGWLRYVLPMPGPRPPLSLNDRGHWRPKAQRVKELREAVTLRCREARTPRDVSHIRVELHYVPKDRRVRDVDNLVATIKPCIDALTAKGTARGWACAGLVADDDPGHVTWLPPILHPPDGNPRWWLEVTVLDPAHAVVLSGGGSGVVQG